MFWYKYAFPSSKVIRRDIFARISKGIKFKRREFAIFRRHKLYIIEFIQPACRLQQLRLHDFIFIGRAYNETLYGKIKSWIKFTLLANNLYSLITLKISLYIIVWDFCTCEFQKEICNNFYMRKRNSMVHWNSKWLFSNAKQSKCH